MRMELYGCPGNLTPRYLKLRLIKFQIVYSWLNKVIISLKELILRGRETLRGRYQGKLSGVANFDLLTVDVSSDSPSWNHFLLLF